MPRIFSPRLWAVVCAWGISSTAHAQTTAPPYFGPLPVRLRDGISGVVYAVEPRPGNVLPQGVSEAFYHRDIGNTSCELLGVYFNALREDSETNNHRLGVRRGLGKGWEAGATLVLASRGSGSTDRIVDAWHHSVLHYHDAFRESNRNAAPLLFLVDGAGNVRINDPNAGADTQTLAFEARKTVWDTTGGRATSHPVQASARFGVKIPLQNQRTAYYLDNGAPDAWAGVSVSGRARGRLWLHGDANVVWAGTGHILVFDNGKRLLPQGIFALEYKAGAKTSLLIQAENALYPFPLPLPNHSGRRAQTTFGVWQTVGTKTRLFGSVSENIWGPRVTSYAPDVMLSFGVRQRL